MGNEQVLHILKAILAFGTQQETSPGLTQTWVKAITRSTSEMDPDQFLSYLLRQGLTLNYHVGDYLTSISLTGYQTNAYNSRMLLSSMLLPRKFKNSPNAKRLHELSNKVKEGSCLSLIEATPANLITIPSYKPFCTATLEVGASLTNILDPEFNHDQILLKTTYKIRNLREYALLWLTTYILRYQSKKHNYPLECTVQMQTPYYMLLRLKVSRGHQAILKDVEDKIRLLLSQTELDLCKLWLQNQYRQYLASNLTTLLDFWEPLLLQGSQVDEPQFFKHIASFDLTTVRDFLNFYKVS